MKRKTEKPMLWEKKHGQTFTVEKKGSVIDII